MNDNKRKRRYHLWILLGLSIIGWMSSCQYHMTYPSVVNSKLPPVLDSVSLVRIDSLTTSGIRGTYYIIYGKNLRGTRQVTFNGYHADLNAAMITDRSVIVQVSDSTPVLNVPDSVVNKLVLTTNMGTATLPFTILVTPSIMNFSPEIGKAGTIVTIRGQFFKDVTAVSVGGTPVSILTQSDSIVTFKIPNDSTQGKISMRAPAGVSNSTDQFIVPKLIIYNNGLPNDDWYANPYSSDVLLDLANTENLNIGASTSLKVTINDAWDGFDIEDDGSDSPIDLTKLGITKLRFTVYRTQNASSLTIDINGDFDDGASINLPPPTSNKSTGQPNFTTFTIPLSQLGNPTTFSYMEIYLNVPDVPSVYYISDITMY